MTNEVNETGDNGETNEIVETTEISEASEANKVIESSEADETFSMGDVMDKVDANMKRIHAGDVLKGTVIAVTDSKVLVNIGYISDGIIEREEICDSPEISPVDLVKVDDIIYVYVIDTNDDGVVLLSKKKAEAVKIWDDFEDSIVKGTPMEVKISEIVKGGAVASVCGVRVFIPASQLSLRYVENLNEFAGKVVMAKVIELDRDKEKVVMSVKELEKIENEIKKNDLLSTIKKGDIRKGVVSRIAKFGAFVDLGGIDGLVHISQLSWGRVNDPSEVVTVGDEVEVYILDVDRQNSKISLGLRNVSENPWKNIYGLFKVESIVEGTVTRTTDFGAFVEIGHGVEGLVHISQISNEHIARPSSVLSSGDKVMVKILEIKEAEQRISLSIKEAQDSGDGGLEEFNDVDHGTTIGDVLKDKLKNFKFD
jgi:small subunit ribosomal protein S1